MFGGGGHSNAAGYKIRADFKAAKEALLKAVSERQPDFFKVFIFFFAKSKVKLLPGLLSLNLSVKYFYEC